MDFISAKEAAKKWRITQRRVAILCSEQRINGAEFVGNMWLIPNSALKPDDGRIVRFAPRLDMSVKPFVKWADGKSQVINNIRNKYPNEIGSGITKYAESFVGGGAVLFDVLGRYNVKNVYISDINKELIQTYVSIRDNVEEVLKK